MHQKVKPIKRNSMKEKFITLLTVASGLKGFGLKFIRVAILVVFVWIGGLKYFHYEADGIVPFVANSPFMSFFYAKDAPEYKEHKNPEGAYVPANREWHEANRTYTFSYGLGALIMSIGILVFLGIFFPKVALVGDTLAIIMTLGTNGIYRGLIYLYTGGKWVENLPSGFKQLAQKNVAGNLSWFFVMDLAVMVLIFLFLVKTKRGKRFAAVGDNEAGANLIGIPVLATKMKAFMICGLFAAFGAILYVSRVGFVTAISGNGYEMKAIAACVIGGISLTGGVGTVIGASIGGVIMASISRLLVFLKISSDYDNTITGILLIVIVVVDALVQRRSVEKARRERLSARVTAAEGGAFNE